ncbi:MAG: hypothetical protein RJA11_505 [Bacteroidota bacterium]|jgi:hypothetical protein
MKELIEIIMTTSHRKLLEQNPLNKGDINLQSNLYQRLYEGIKSGKYKTDADAAFDIYGTIKPDRRYSTLKARFRKKLLQTLFFWDLESENISNRGKSLYNCRKNAILAQLLLGQGAFYASSEIAKDILREARIYEYPEFEVISLEILRKYYSRIGNRNKYKQINDQLIIARKHLLIEKTSEDIFWNIIHQCEASQEFKYDLIQDMMNAERELLCLRNEHTSYVTVLNHHRITIKYLELLGHHNEIIQQCLWLENYFKKLPIIFSRAPIQEMQIHIISAYHKLGDLEQCNETIQKSYDIIRPGEYNWFLIKEYELMMRIRDGNPREAWGIYKEVISNRTFTVDSIRQERWNILLAYLVAFIRLSNIDNELINDPMINTFRMSKFLNEVHYLSSDKRGGNNSIIMLEAIFLLIEKNYETFFQKSESLQKNKLRYFKNHESYRINCFMKLLVSLSKYIFAPESFPKIFAHFENDLTLNKPNPNRVISDIEIIPLEQLASLLKKHLISQSHS